jgi:NtrC-family two-component system sensor histidine kinase KinB
MTVLQAAGTQQPSRLDDLRLDGLVVEDVRQAIANGSGSIAPVDLAQTIAVEQDGRVRRLFPRVVSLPSLTAGRGGAVLVLSDVTEVVRLDEMRSELVAVASHELQTPLTTLRMTLLMLREAAHVLPERQRELVATSLIGVDQLSEIVREYLDLTRIEAGELRLWSLLNSRTWAVRPYDEWKARLRLSRSRSRHASIRCCPWYPPIRSA